MSEYTSRIAFGSEYGVDDAIKAGLIDKFDLLFLKEGKIGWIDENYEKILLDNTKQVLFVDALPETGENKTMYVYDDDLYLWDGERFVSPTADSVSEDTVDSKIKDVRNDLTNEIVNKIDDAIKSVTYVEITADEIDSMFEDET